MSNYVVIFILMWFSSWGYASRDNDLQHLVMKNINIRRVIQQYLSIPENLQLNEINKQFYEQGLKLLPELRLVHYYTFIHFPRAKIPSLSMAKLNMLQSHHQLICRDHPDSGLYQVPSVLQFFHPQVYSQNLEPMMDYPEILCSDPDRVAKMKECVCSHRSVLDKWRTIEVYGEMEGLPLAYNPRTSELHLIVMRSELNIYLQVPAMLIFIDDKNPEHTHTENMREWMGVPLANALYSSHCFGLVFHNPVTQKEITMIFDDDGVLKQVSLLILKPDEPRYGLNNMTMEFREFVDNTYTYVLNVAETMDPKNEFTAVYAFYHVFGY